MSTDVQVSGPLFEGRIDVKGGARAAAEAVAERAESLVRAQLALRSRFRTAIYGHIGDAVRTQIKTLPGGEIGARVFLGGQAAFLGPILEGGAAAHFIAAKRQRIRVPALGRRATVEGKFKPLAILVGAGDLVFRQYAHHPGTPAYHWRERAEAALESEVPSIVERAFARAMAA